MYVDITHRKRAENALATLNAISQTINQSLDLDFVLNAALEKVMELFNPHSTHIRLLDEQAQELVLTAHKGLSDKDLKCLTKRLKVKDAVSRYAVRTGQALVVTDTLADPRTTDRPAVKRISSLQREDVANVIR